MFFDTARKRIDELEAYLKESQKGRKKVEDDLSEINLNNLAFSKECVKSLQESYSIILDSFESALTHEEHFYPNRSISQEQVCLYQAIEDMKMVSLVD